jgi:4-amino-4-deoxy-L-arabinose transferase-like glycosyltransferase
MSDVGAARPTTQVWWQQTRFRVLGGLLTLTLCMLAVQVTGFETRDSDSRLYAAMSRDMAEMPLARWAAPQWNGHWDRTGLFHEHPPGMFMMGALLVRVGLGPFPAVYLINFLSYGLALWLLYLIGRRFGDPLLGALAVLVWILTPGFCQYVVRGNHENLVALAVVAAVFGLLCLERWWARALVYSVALCSAIAVKGIAGLALVALAGVIWLFYRRNTATLTVVLVGCVAALGMCLGLEYWHEAVTGVSFWGNYSSGQIRYSVGGEFDLLKKLSNLAFYAVRPLWFFFPWHLFILYALYLRYRGNEFRIGDRVFWLGLAVLGVFIFGFTLADRKADRYILPAYPILALSAAWCLCHLPVRPAIKIRAWIRRGLPYVSYAVMGFLFLAVWLEIYFGTHYDLFIRLWPAAE